MTRAREALLLAAACSLLYLTAAGDNIPFFTRGEPREGLVVREMLRTGRWLVPARPAGEPARKPPLYYWAAATTLHLLPGRPETALRLPSVLLATTAVLGTWAIARAAFGAPAALPAALVLATAFEWMRAATSARVDMALAAALTAVLAGWLLALHGTSRPRERRGQMIAAAGAALGTLAKGPVALVLPALAAAGFVLARRDLGELRRLRPLLVLVLAAGGAGLWYLLALLREGPVFLDVVVRENLVRFFDTEAAATGHDHGIGYLLLLGLVGLLPWTPLLPSALAPLARIPRSPAATLTAAWIVAGLAFFSLASAKRSVYLLPLFPAIALLTGAAAAAEPGERSRLAAAVHVAARAYAPALAVLALLLGGLAAGLDVGSAVRPWLRPADAAGVDAVTAAIARAAAPLALLALATAAAVPIAARAAREPSLRRLVLVCAAVAVAWTVSFNTAVFPAIAGARSMRSFLARTGRLLPAGAPLYALFPADPGVRFYAASLRPWRADDARGGHLLLWERDWRRLRDSAGRPLRVLAVSEARQGGRGHLALAVAPPGPLGSAPESDTPPRPPGLRARQGTE